MAPTTKHSVGADQSNGTISVAAGRPVKRSFSISGHRTSISLEAAFWDAFRDFCEKDGVALAQRLAEIDRSRGEDTGLSGAVRVWVLRRYQMELEHGQDQPGS